MQLAASIVANSSPEALDSVFGSFRGRLVAFQPGFPARGCEVAVRHRALFAPAIPVSFRYWSLVEAELLNLRLLLSSSNDWTHVALLTGVALPLLPVADIEGVLAEGVSYLTSRQESFPAPEFAYFPSMAGGTLSVVGLPVAASPPLRELVKLREAVLSSYAPWVHEYGAVISRQAAAFLAGIDPLVQELQVCLSATHRPYRRFLPTALHSSPAALLHPLRAMVPWSALEGRTAPPVPSEGPWFVSCSNEAELHSVLSV